MNETTYDIKILKFIEISTNYYKLFNRMAVDYYRSKWQAILKPMTPQLNIHMLLLYLSTIQYQGIMSCNKSLQGYHCSIIR